MSNPLSDRINNTHITNVGNGGLARELKHKEKTSSV
jgi:hypothetical protein